MAPYFIMCALTTLIVRCRELLVCSWLVGHLLNEVVNFVLKRTFKEKRPAGAPAVGCESMAFLVPGLACDASTLRLVPGF